MNIKDFIKRKIVRISDLMIHYDCVYNTGRDKMIIYHKDLNEPYKPTIFAAKMAKVSDMSEVEIIEMLAEIDEAKCKLKEAKKLERENKKKNISTEETPPKKDKK